MKKIHLICFLFLLSYSGISQGTVINKETYNRLPLPQLGDGSKSIGDPFKKNVNLTSYSPYILDQGDKNICVPISTIYYATGIRSAYLRGITDRARISESLSLSPLYNFQKLNYKCDVKVGIDFVSMIYDLEDRGGIQFRHYPSLDCSGRLPSENFVTRSKNFVRMCGDRDSFGNPEVSCKDKKVLYTIKKYLSDGYPVVVGLKINSDFKRKYNFRANRYYKTSPEFSTLLHSVTIVGYENYTFKIANSWGNTWGDNGFFYMLESDLSDALEGAFTFDVEFLDSPVQSSPANNSINPGNSLGATLEFYKLSQGSLDNQGKVQTRYDKQPFAYLGNGVYTLKKNDYTQYDEFQAEVRNLTPDIHLSVISYDPGQNSVNKHWPRDNYGSGVDDLIQTSNTSYMLPDTNRVFTITGGTKDYLIIFLSKKPIDKDIREIVDKIRSYPDINGSIQDKLKNALGRRLILPQEINYNREEMIAELKNPNATGDVVPLILEINHR